MNEYNAEIGQRIKESREQKDLTRKELAVKADISEDFLRSIENGKRGISAYTVRNIALALNVTSDYIIFGTSETDRRLGFASLALASLSEEESKFIPGLIEKVAEIYRNYDKENIDPKPE